MIFRPRHLLIRWILPLSWRRSPGQKIRILQEFAQTELDSAWQSIYALERVTYPELRKMLFKHAFEEMHHSDLFSNFVRKECLQPSITPMTRREPVIALENTGTREAVEFFSFLTVGESEIQRDFAVYETAIGDKELKLLFRSLREDEQEHAEQSEHALEKLVEKVGLSMTWIKLRHVWKLAYKRYISAMNKIGACIMTIFLFAAYLIFAGIFAGQARHRLRMGREEQLAILRAQQEQLAKRLVRS